MKKDIILAGVGGQGILTIATIIGDAAATAGVNLKQAEVHGMSQRGGDVQSNLRLSTDAIYSDLIKQGSADIIISMEPMEALRYIPYLSKEGWVVSSSHPFKNIPNYPDEQAMMEEFNSLPHSAALPIEDLAKQNNLPMPAPVIRRKPRWAIRAPNSSAARKYFSSICVLEAQYTQTEVISIQN